MSSMSYGSIPLRAGGRASWPARAAALFETIRADWRSRRAARNVAALSDEMLRDIGVSRSEIDQAVRHGRGRRA